MKTKNLIKRILDKLIILNIRNFRPQKNQIIFEQCPYPFVSILDLEEAKKRLKKIGVEKFQEQDHH